MDRKFSLGNAAARGYSYKGLLLDDHNPQKLVMPRITYSHGSIKREVIDWGDAEAFGNKERIV